MNYKDLMTALQARADEFAKPVGIDVDGIGRIFVRKRTVAEFEAMADMEDKGQGKFALALSRILCEESGARFQPEQRDALSVVLARQPEHTFHDIMNASDGLKKEEDAKDSGN